MMENGFYYDVNRLLKKVYLDIFVDFIDTYEPIPIVLKKIEMK